MDMVGWGSQASELGLDMDQTIVSVQLPRERFAKEWLWIPALMILALIIYLQRRRRTNHPDARMASTAS